jgi:CHAT domain-containing protein/tetratricopeptide (TPR) repeat protein
MDLTLLFAAAVLWAPLPPTEPSQGLVVEEAQAAFAADHGGVKPGDVLLGWHRAAAPPAIPEPASGAFSRPSDVLAVEQEEAQRAEFRITVLRAGERIELVLPPGLWRLKVRPPLPAAELETYERGRALVAGADPAAGFAVWNEQARAFRGSGEHLQASWLLYTLARAAVQKRLWPAADAAFVEARDAARAAGDRVAAGFALTFQGRSQETRGQLEAADACHREALEEYRASGGSALLEAWGLSQTARVAFDRGNLDLAESINREALAAAERLAPGSTQVAGSRVSLGLIAARRGDLAAAEEHNRAALLLLEALPPGPTDLALVLNNLGSVLYARGDLSGSEDLLLRSNALNESSRAGSTTHARGLTNLGTIAGVRGDLDLAEQYHTRALAIQEKLTPGSQHVALMLRNLGDVAARRGDLAAANDLYVRSLEMYERWTPDAFEVSLNLLNLADVAERRGKLEEAELHARRALAVVEKRGLKGLELATSLNTLGRLARARGDHASAQEYFERALAIGAAIAPGSRIEAETLHALAGLAAAEDLREEALAWHLRSLDALEKQRSRVGGSDEARSRFGAAYAPYYQQTIDLLVADGRGEEAFHVLERFRARSFLALLAERELVFSGDVPPELDRERRRVNVEYDRALAALQGGTSGDLEIRRLALVEARRAQGETRSRIRAASARLTALEYPEPLDLQAVRQVLDPGTLLLSYVIGDARSYLFAVGPGPDDFRVAPLDTDRKRLREMAGAFRDLLQQESPLRRGALRLSSRRLSALLIAPVAPAIARADRIVVVPDGPLHLLPFGALADPLSAGAERYLVEARPLHVASSATVFAEIKKGRRAAGAGELVAFGDPDYTGGRAAGREPAQALGAATLRGLQLQPLPAARREMRDLAGLFPNARVYVGGAATEEEAKAALPHGSRIHFACHGLAQEDSPLDSALALSLPSGSRPGRDNGLLQAWEIFEQVRIDADLVTLSACGTALGREMSGEGILGLTRAFQYAGARSVLASLWAVNDASTADLMRRFYSHLKRGRTKDAALRAAQIEMLRRPASSHPYRWAAFQLAGDWR